MKKQSKWQILAQQGMQVNCIRGGGNRQWYKRKKWYSDLWGLGLLRKMVVEERRSKGEKTCTAPLGKYDRLDTRIDCARRGFYFPPFATAPSSMSPEARQKRLHLGSTVFSMWNRNKERARNKEKICMSFFFWKEMSMRWFFFLFLPNNVYIVFIVNFLPAAYCSCCSIQGKQIQPSSALLWMLTIW